MASLAGSSSNLPAAVACSMIFSKQFNILRDDSMFVYENVRGVHWESLSAIQSGGERFAPPAVIELHEIALTRLVVTFLIIPCGYEFEVMESFISRLTIEFHVP